MGKSPLPSMAQLLILTSQREWLPGEFHFITSVTKGPFPLNSWIVTLVLAPVRAQSGGEQVTQGPGAHSFLPQSHPPHYATQAIALVTTGHLQG